MAAATAAAAALAPLLVSESWAQTPFSGALLAGALVLVVGGAAVVASSRPLRAVAARDPVAA